MLHGARDVPELEPCPKDAAGGYDAPPEYLLEPEAAERVSFKALVETCDARWYGVPLTPCEREGGL